MPMEKTVSRGLSLFFFTVQTQDKVTAMDKDPEVVVDVTAFQWNWKFGYANLGAEISPTGSVYEGRDEESDPSEYIVYQSVLFHLV